MHWCRCSFQSEQRSLLLVGFPRRLRVSYNEIHLVLDAKKDGQMLFAGWERSFNCIRRRLRISDKNDTLWLLCYYGSDLMMVAVVWLYLFQLVRSLN